MAKKKKPFFKIPPIATGNARGLRRAPLKIKLGLIGLILFFGGLTYLPQDVANIVALLVMSIGVVWLFLQWRRKKA